LRLSSHRSLDLGEEIVATGGQIDSRVEVAVDRVRNVGNTS
jgi:hypothetical protein